MQERPYWKNSLYSRAMNYRVILFCIFLSIGITKSFSQQKEWHKIMEALKKETSYFQGKKGYIRLIKQKYNTFTINEYTVSDTVIKMDMKLFDRFENIPGTEHKKQERSFDPGWGFPLINKVTVLYGSDFYFADYPESIFIQLDFSEEFLIASDGMLIRHKEEWDRYSIFIPVRMQKANSILKAITKYQKKLLTYELERDRTH